jgi:plasmid maintenance system killer protein
MQSSFKSEHSKEELFASPRKKSGKDDTPKIFFTSSQPHEHQDSDFEDSTASPSPNRLSHNSHSSTKKLISTNTKMIPNPIQKELKAKTLQDLDISACIAKLRAPPSKTFERQLEKMKKVRMSQQKIIEDSWGKFPQSFPDQGPVLPDVMKVEAENQILHAEPMSNGNLLGIPRQIHQVPAMENDHSPVSACQPWQQLSIPHDGCRSASMMIEELAQENHPARYSCGDGYEQTFQDFETPNIINDTGFTYR